jgi:hypothetical protein
LPEIKEVTITLRRPTGPNDPGLCEIGFFTHVDGIVSLTDESGTPLRRDGGSTVTTRNTKGKDAPTWSAPAGNDPRAVAGRLLHQKFSSIKSGSDFNRPLHYPKIGIA